jgi:hypothetical protein
VAPFSKKRAEKRSAAKENGHLPGCHFRRREDHTGCSDRRRPGLPATAALALGIGGAAGFLGVVNISWLQERPGPHLTGRVMSLAMFAAVCLDPRFLFAGHVVGATGGAIEDPGAGRARGLDTRDGASVLLTNHGRNSVTSASIHSTP